MQSQLGTERVGFEPTVRLSVASAFPKETGLGHLVTRNSPSSADFFLSAIRVDLSVGKASPIKAQRLREALVDAALESAKLK